jgi:sugar lactone lactonase YvrE
MRRKLLYLAAPPLIALSIAAGPKEPGEQQLFVAKPLTAEDSGFTEGIEGPGCDADGNVYAVSFRTRQTIGKVAPDGKASAYVELPNKGAGNGIVFDHKGLMYVADYITHSVLRIDPATKKIEVFAHEASMHQPNDLAIAPDDTIYASDPDWSGKHKGQIWKVDRAGKIARVAADLGTVNGIDVSPDGKTLFINESEQQTVSSFPINKDGTLGPQRELIKFAQHGTDGMRCDVDGNLYVTRHGHGTVVKLSPQGKVIREIDVLGAQPSNICFGGPDGRTAYVTEVTHKRLVQFRVDRPGLAWQRWHEH